MMPDGAETVQEISMEARPKVMSPKAAMLPGRRDTSSGAKES